MNHLRLLLIWLLCLTASLYAGLRMLYAIFTNPQRAWIMAVAHDQLANAAANGDPDETISARADRARSEGRHWGCILCRVLDWIDVDHCKNARDDSTLINVDISNMPPQNLLTGADHAGSVFRVYLGGNAVFAWYLWVAEGHALMALSTYTAQGAVLVWLMMATGVVMLADTVVNDFLPARYHWRRALHQRHFILAAMAFCYVAFIYVDYPKMQATGLLVYYVWSAGTIMLAAFIDASQRSKEVICNVCN